MSIPVPTAELSVMLEHCKLMERQLSELLDTPICQEAAFIIGRLQANAFLVREACEYYVNKAEASRSYPIPEPSHERTYRCENCNCDVIPVEGVTALWSRGYWYCAKCVSVVYINGQPTVQFPSKGKLIPNTIMHEQAEPGAQC